MATYTAGDQINRALRLLGVLAEGETTSASVSQDSLTALNQMIDSWNTERLSVFSTQDQMFTWPAGFINRTLGPTGDFVGNRPILLDDATYYRDPGTNVSFGIKFINQQQYDGIAVKTVTSTYPQVIFVNMTYPDIDMFIYPKPTRDLEWHFISVEELTPARQLGDQHPVPAWLPTCLHLQLGLRDCARVWCRAQPPSFPNCYDQQAQSEAHQQP